MSKTLTKDELSLNAHVEDLRERMRMLQGDRKANIDVLEANKAANKEDIKKLREDNKEFRQKLASLQRVSKLDSFSNSLSMLLLIRHSPAFYVNCRALLMKVKRTKRNMSKKRSTTFAKTMMI